MSSKRMRPARAREILAASGTAIVVHELQGDLAFATTERAIRRIRQTLHGVRWIILDLRRVSAIDHAGQVLLQSLLAELAAADVTTLLADPRSLPAVGGLLRSDFSTERLRDTETAIEWAEEALLMRGRCSPFRRGCGCRSPARTCSPN